MRARARTDTHTRTPGSSQPGPQLAATLAAAALADLPTPGDPAQPAQPAQPGAREAALRSFLAQLPLHRPDAFPPPPPPPAAAADKAD
jgi:hypothetical protein